MITSLVAWLGRRSLVAVGHIGGITQLGLEAVYWTAIAPVRGKGLRWRESVKQMVLIGVNSLPVVFLISLFTGMILALQGAYSLRRFGATLLVADLVGIALTRELGPLLTAIVIAGRSGSAIAAEIGTMMVSEEIDALRSMGLNPVRFLVVPRLLALLIMGPCLTTLADFIGVLGGYLVGTTALHIGPSLYITETVQAVFLKDITTGLIKSLAFALIIGMIGCYQGFQARGGAEEVGRSTTASVVTSIFSIIAADNLFTWLFYYLE